MKNFKKFRKIRNSEKMSKSEKKLFFKYFFSQILACIEYDGNDGVGHMNCDVNTCSTKDKGI